MDSEELEELRQALGRLKQEHRDLDSAIGAMEDGVFSNQLELLRMMKK